MNKKLFEAAIREKDSAVSMLMIVKSCETKKEFQICKRVLLESLELEGLEAPEDNVSQKEGS